MRKFKFNVVVEKDEHGYYAYCPLLDGCQTQGRTLEEALSNMREAIELYWETLSEEERKKILLREVKTLDMEVQVA